MVKLGVQLPEIEYQASWHACRDMARVAEEVGFDSLWVGDHLLYGTPQGHRGPWEAWTMLAAVAAVTERIELGPLVAATSFHNPAMIAKKAATLDEISGGRLILGLGAGWNRVEYEAYGFPFDHRVSRFEEAFTIIRTLLADGYIDFVGRYHQARDCTLSPRGPRPGGLPLMVGSDGPRMLEITLPHVAMWNAWFSWFGNEAHRLPAQLAKLDAACQKVGRDPATLVKTVAVLVGIGNPEPRNAVSSGSEPSRPISGPPDAIAEQLAGYRKMGIDHLQLVLDPINASSIEKLAPVVAQLADP